LSVPNEGFFPETHRIYYFTALSVTYCTVLNCSIGTTS
jgi:hypothetical protein